MKVFRSIALTLIALQLYGCGSGGGGGSNFEADGNVARVQLEVAPQKIDSGDRTTLTIVLTKIEKDQADGLVVKVLHPSGMRYVDGSAVLSGKGFDDFEPFVVTAAADESGYVLFHVPTRGFPDKHNIGIFTFMMTGLYEIRNGTISVDVDAADSDDRRVFDPANPQFTALASHPIRVLDDGGA